MQQFFNSQSQMSSFITLAMSGLKPGTEVQTFEISEKPLTTNVKKEKEKTDDDHKQKNG